MNETEYHVEADKQMQELLQFFEKLEDSTDIEPELESGVLNVIMPDDREYVINKHTPSRQIWVSSPYTGAGYFEFRENSWLPKRAPQAEGKNLFDFISAEVNSRL